KIVWETSVPSTTGSRSRTRPSRRATISALEGSPSRAGKVADIRTPIITPRAASRLRTRAPGRAASRIACQDSARRNIDAHISAKATSTQTGVAATIAMPIECSPIRSSASAASPMPAAAPAATAPRRATLVTRARAAAYPAAIAGDVGRHHGRARRERLGEHHAEALAAERRRAQQIGFMKQPPLFVLGHAPGDLDALVVEQVGLDLVGRSAGHDE